MRVRAASTQGEVVRRVSTNFKTKDGALLATSQQIGYFKG
jgi:hypothetical protein